MKSILTLWKFSRPHTIVGSVISMCAIFVMVIREDRDAQLPLLLMAIVTAIGCNIYIVGINQVADVHIDRINKPWLPIPAGLVSVKNAKIIVGVSLLVSLCTALYVSPWFFAIIVFSAGSGWAYSMPPLYLKKHHFSAMLAITLVRGVMINICIFLVLNHKINAVVNMPPDMQILTLFIVIFTIAISWFKDLPDMEGDAVYHIRSMAIVYSPRTVFTTGNLLVGGMYMLSIGFYYAGAIGAVPVFSSLVLFWGHIILLLLFIANAWHTNLAQPYSVIKFYKRFWWFFFAEYALYLMAYL